MVPVAFHPGIQFPAGLVRGRACSFVSVRHSFSRLTLHVFPDWNMVSPPDRNGLNRGFEMTGRTSVSVHANRLNKDAEIESGFDQCLDGITGMDSIYLFSVPPLPPQMSCKSFQFRRSGCSTPTIPRRSAEYRPDFNRIWQKCFRIDVHIVRINHRIDLRGPRSIILNRKPY